MRKALRPVVLAIAILGLATGLATGAFFLIDLVLWPKGHPAEAALPEAGTDIVRQVQAGDRPRRLPGIAGLLFTRQGKGPRADAGATGNLADTSPARPMQPVAGVVTAESELDSVRLAALAALVDRYAHASVAESGESQASSVLLVKQRPSASLFLATAPFSETEPVDPQLSRAPAGLPLENLRNPTARGPREFFGGLTEREFRAREKRCLTTAIYFEARGESVEGQIAVAQVIMNRVRSEYYPDTICGVVYQGAERRTGCQFSFACDGAADIPRERAHWEMANAVAQKVLDGEVWIDTVGDASHYHATYVRPSWSRFMRRKERIGTHVFYRANFSPLFGGDPAGEESVTEGAGNS